MISSSLAISPLDGRYYHLLSFLSDHFSEKAFFRYRILVELKFLIFLAKEKIINKRITNEEESELLKIAEDFSQKDFEKIKFLEASTKHDVKAAEYFLRECFTRTSLSALSSFIHLGLTSEDVNNLTYNLLLKDFLIKVYLPKTKDLSKILKDMAKEYKNIKMLGRTHGQPAVPTTLGKELAVFSLRLENVLNSIDSLELSGKLNGAVGNFNALVFIFPKIDWLSKSKKFVESLNLVWNPLTTQIESGDSLVNLFNEASHLNSILIGLCQDIWYYQSLGYFFLKPKKGEVGSSTMPQKVNPIDFENAEGNFQVANSLFDLFSSKLPISRLQRDLSDSTVKRNIGVAFGHTILALEMLSPGLKKIEVNEQRMLSDLSADWSILSEGVQVFLRINGVERSYELVKGLTRGNKMKKNDYLKLVEKLPISKSLKSQLKKLTPENYIGIADKLVDFI